MVRFFSVVGFVTVCSFAGVAQDAQGTLDAKVDERVELISIIFRLAGNSEYNRGDLKTYSSDIDQYFARYKGQAAVKFAKKMATKNGVALDAPMDLAVHLSPPPELKPVVPFTEDLLDPRWGKANALRFARLAHNFYRDTHFEKFAAAHRNLYDLAEKRFGEVLQAVDVSWYRKFFGEGPRAHFQVLLGLNNGDSNYGPHIRYADGHEDAFAIIGCWTTDEAGNPTFAVDEYLWGVIHEFAHSFSNPAVDQYWTQFAAAAQKVFEPVAKQMDALAYGAAKTMVYESLVRAVVILYVGEKGEEVERAIAGEQQIGFVWMRDLCQLLQQQYEANRNRYPRFADFMPVVADFYTSLVTHINDDLNNKLVHVVGIQPFANHDANVDPAIKELTITFDKELNTKKYGICEAPEKEDQGGPPGGPENWPFSKPFELVFLPGNTAVKVRMDLKPNWSYGFLVCWFVTPDGLPVEHYIVDFHTR